MLSLQLTAWNKGLTLKLKILVPYETKKVAVTLPSCMHIWGKDGHTTQGTNQTGQAEDHQYPMQLASNPSSSKNEIPLWYRSFCRKSAKHCMLTMHRDKAQLLHRLLAEECTSMNICVHTQHVLKSKGWKPKQAPSSNLASHTHSTGGSVIQLLLWTSLHWPHTLHISSLLP